MVTVTLDILPRITMTHYLQSGSSIDVNLLEFSCIISSMYPSTGVSDKNILNLSPIPNIA